MDMPQVVMICVAAVSLHIIWRRMYPAPGTMRRNAKLSRGLFVTYVFCLAAILVVLLRWSSATVRNDSSALLFYLLLDLSCLLLIQGAFHLCGISLRDDAIERGNPAVALVAAAQAIAATCCIAGSNIGEGPGAEAVLFCLLLSNGTLLVLCLVLDLATGVGDVLTIERDVQAGLRISAWYVATGAVLGASVAGDWTSYGGTLRDFVRYAWPVTFLFLVMVFIERRFARTPVGGQANSRHSACIAAVVLIAGLAYAIRIGFQP
jgi:hypothetical protein